ncbi:MAG TPA: hypothetical protein VGH62_01490 [Bradyrhizobium sp.]|jgi:hypothetical protein
MNLADHILAARGGEFDLLGIATSVGHYLERAERFEMADDVVFACNDLVRSKPSALNAALPMCRLPYPTMWIEYRGGLCGPNNRDSKTAPVPVRQGFLIESPLGDMEDLQGQVGWATCGWVHSELHDGSRDAINISPFSIYFDWRPDGDVRQNIRMMHAVMLERYPDPGGRPALKAIIDWFERRFLGNSAPEEIAKFFMTRTGWEKHSKDPKEIEALRESERHMLPGLSPHGVKVLAAIARHAANGDDPKADLRVVTNFLTDIQGEGPFIECFLAMLNSRNCIAREPVDYGKLNKARAKRGKGPLMSFTKTKLVLTRAQPRVADASGITREAARQHLVRGHFKIRRTGVYWWSPFLRGDGKLGTVKRAEYEVA